MSSLTTFFHSFRLECHVYFLFGTMPTWATEQDSLPCFPRAAMHCRHGSPFTKPCPARLIHFHVPACLIKVLVRKRRMLSGTMTLANKHFFMQTNSPKRTPPISLNTLFLTEHFKNNQRCKPSAVHIPKSEIQKQTAKIKNHFLLLLPFPCKNIDSYWEPCPVFGGYLFREVQY